MAEPPGAAEAPLLIGAEEALAQLLDLHDEVDREAGALAGVHGSRLRCGRGCSACCVDDLRVFEIEALRIRRAHPTLLQSGSPHREGACAFLAADGSCRVHAERPYVCRTQGLPLRWQAESPEGKPVEQRDICELNAEGPSLDQLPEKQCWTLGPVEDRLGSIQEAWDGGIGRRVALRSLFDRAEPPPRG